MNFFGCKYRREGVLYLKIYKIIVWFKESYDRE